MVRIDYKATIIPGGSFTWGEYAWLPQLGKYAEPNETQYRNAIQLFTRIQKFREELNRPLIITSGARTPEYVELLRSKGIPAAVNGAHNHWEGLDLTCPSLSTPRLWRWFDARWPGRMELLRYTPSWVHLDIRKWGDKVRFAP